MEEGANCAPHKHHSQLWRDLCLRTAQIVLQARVDFEQRFCSDTELQQLYSNLGCFNFRDRVEKQCLDAMLRLRQELAENRLHNGVSIAIYKVLREDATSSSLSVEPGATDSANPRELLERWSIHLEPLDGATAGKYARSSKAELAFLYKRAIIFARSVYSYARMAPAFQLCRFARRQPAQAGGTKMAQANFWIDYEFELGDPQQHPVTPRPSLNVATCKTPIGTICAGLYFSAACEIAEGRNQSYPEVAAPIMCPNVVILEDYATNECGAQRAAYSASEIRHVHVPMLAETGSNTRQAHSDPTKSDRLARIPTVEPVAHTPGVSDSPVAFMRSTVNWTCHDDKPVSALTNALHRQARGVSPSATSGLACDVSPSPASGVVCSATTAASSRSPHSSWECASQVPVADQMGSYSSPPLATGWMIKCCNQSSAASAQDMASTPPLAVTPIMSEYFSADVSAVTGGNTDAKNVGGGRGVAEIGTAHNLKSNAVGYSMSVTPPSLPPSPDPLSSSTTPFQGEVSAAKLVSPVPSKSGPSGWNRLSDGGIVDGDRLRFRLADGDLSPPEEITANMTTQNRLGGGSCELGFFGESLESPCSSVPDLWGGNQFMLAIAPDGGGKGLFELGMSLDDLGAGSDRSAECPSEASTLTSTTHMNGKKDRNSALQPAHQDMTAATQESEREAEIGTFLQECQNAPEVFGANGCSQLTAIDDQLEEFEAFARRLGSGEKAPFSPIAETQQ